MAHRNKSQVPFSSSSRLLIRRCRTRSRTPGARPIQLEAVRIATLARWLRGICIGLRLVHAGLRPAGQANRRSNRTGRDERCFVGFGVLYYSYATTLGTYLGYQLITAQTEALDLVKQGTNTHQHQPTPAQHKKKPKTTSCCTVPVAPRSIMRACINYCRPLAGSGAFSSLSTHVHIALCFLVSRSPGLPLSFRPRCHTRALF